MQSSALTLSLNDDYTYKKQEKPKKDKTHKKTHKNYKTQENTKIFTLTFIKLRELTHLKRHGKSSNLG